MAMKGQEGIIYIIGFLIALIMVVGALSVSLPLFGTVIGSSKKTEIETKSNVYTSEYALKFARVYAKTALTYSVYQAMYDLGKKGGGSACELVEDKNEIEKNLKTEILKNLNGYTSGTNAFYSFMGKDVVLPHFSEPGMNITETASGISVSTEGDRTIYLKETASHGIGGETIMVEISSKMENAYGFDFFSLHEKAIDVAGRIKGCTSTLDTKEGDYEIVATSDNATEPCTVTANVTDTSKKFPVFNGTNTSFEPIGIVFSVSFGKTCTPSVSGGTGGTTPPPSGTTPPGGSTTPPGLTLAGRTIVLDPGHGGGDSGALGPSGTNIVEREVNLQIARMIGAEMTNRGARVIYTRNDDSNPDLAARTAVANNNNADIFISIHANSDQNCNGRGTETFVYCLCSADAENNAVLDMCNVGNCYSSNAMFQSSRQLAEDIQPLLVNTLGTADRGIRGADLGVLRDARMPAVLIETAFICNLQEANLLNDPAQQTGIGGALTDSLENFYAP